MRTIEELARETALPFVAADENGFITQVNERFEAVFGWSSGEIVGKLLTTIIPTNLHDAHHLGVARLLATGKLASFRNPIVLRAVTKAGREFKAEHSIIAERRRGRWAFGATIRPLE